ncbi:hypothetical protein RHMOL_Rhmol04G0203600 [Rhododendron molle]|uniref:Uncharacterized protein n=1 Tax=Rhododendron molle TaxID=49168 RepID=A0ACC0P2T0_RHOML|nr:hypothetical protein RHMOL_Rhmol04G0203600 [Rhododendron molle]
MLDICLKPVLKGNAHIDVVKPNAKRVHSIKSTMLYSGDASKSSFNPHPGSRTQPRIFSHFSAALSLVYEKLLEAGFLKRLLPTPLPRTFPVSYNLKAYSIFHQMPGHHMDASCRL